MTNSDLAIIESDRADRWLVGLIQAFVAVAMDDPEARATGTYEDGIDAPVGVMGVMGVMGE